jgi:hypothetical protein
MNQVLFTELQRLCAFATFATCNLPRAEASQVVLGATGVEAVAVADFGSETADMDASEVSLLTHPQQLSLSSIKTICNIVL